LNLKIKIDKISWAVLSVAIISLILSIIALAAGKHTFGPLIGFSIVFGQVFYDRFKEIKRSSYGVAQSDNKLKPEFDKYEITLLTITNLILIVITAGYDGVFRTSINLFPLLIVVGVLLLMGVAYHIDRKNDWKKQQQSLIPSTLQN